MKTTALTLILCICLFPLSAETSTSIKNYLLGQFEPKDDKLFVTVPTGYSAKATAQYLRKEAMDAFIKMAECAQTENITLKIVSATRTFNAQKTIWETKWAAICQGSQKSNEERAKSILHYSSMPGTSRHHWGTDIDINSIEPEYFNTKQGKLEYDWLAKNAATFGFRQPYTAKNTLRPTGYEEEKWHWSYLPLSRDMLSQYTAIITYSDLTNFEGSDAARPLKAIEHYVLGIHPSCKPTDSAKK